MGAKLIHLRPRRESATVAEMSPSLLPSLASPARIGIVGTGFIAAGLMAVLAGAPDLRPSRVLTRRHPTGLSGMLAEHHTRSLAELLDTSDLIVECSGDVAHAAEVIEAALRAGLPVVTMGTEFHVTVGSWFHGKGMLTEAEGDQPGCLAALCEEVSSMGFRPLVFGNIKGFLNHQPSTEEMRYWSNRQGISLAQVTSFTDGTKLQMEQAFIANGLGADLSRRGLLGPAGMDLRAGGDWLAAHAAELGRPIADYLLNPALPAGVFITAEHPDAARETLAYLKLGDGPYYTLLRPYHLCHLEVPRTIRRVLAGGPPLLDNGPSPEHGVCAVAKQDLPAGTRIDRAIGGEWVRGEAVRLAEAGGAAPFGLLGGARLRRRVACGDTVALDDVDLAACRATEIWHELRGRPQDLLAEIGSAVGRAG
jgi:predicted homoserine dehydrogenase-like protein